MWNSIKIPIMIIYAEKDSVPRKSKNIFTLSVILPILLMFSRHEEF